MKSVFVNLTLQGLDGRHGWTVSTSRSAPSYKMQTGHCINFAALNLQLSFNSGVSQRSAMLHSWPFAGNRDKQDNLPELMAAYKM